MTIVNAEAVALAVNAANTVRVESGEPAISGLDRSAERMEASECVLARAFNFKCEVDGFNDGYGWLSGTWYVSFTEDYAHQAQRLADALGSGIIHPDIPGLIEDRADGASLAPATLTAAGDGRLRVLLPEAVAAIAIAFDHGGLDPKHFLPIDEAPTL